MKTQKNQDNNEEKKTFLFQSFLTICSNFQPCISNFQPCISNFQPCIKPIPVISRNLQPFSAFYGQFQPFPVVSSHVNPFSPIIICVQPFLAIVQFCFILFYSWLLAKRIGNKQVNKDSLWTLTTSLLVFSIPKKLLESWHKNYHT